MTSDQAITSRRRRGRRPGRQREHHGADAERDQRGGHDVQPGAEHRAEPRSTPWLAAPSHGETPGDSAGDHDGEPREHQAPAEPRAARDGGLRRARATRRPDVSSSAARRSGSRARSATSAATSRNATPKYWSVKLPCTPNLSSVSLQRLGHGAGGHLGDDPEHEPGRRGARRTRRPSTGSSRRAARPNGERRPKGRGGGTSPVARTPAPDVAAGREHRWRATHRAADGDRRREQRPQVVVGERLHELGPPNGVAHSSQCGRDRSRRSCAARRPTPNTPKPSPRGQAPSCGRAAR